MSQANIVQWPHDRTVMCTIVTQPPYAKHRVGFDIINGKISTCILYKGDDELGTPLQTPEEKQNGPWLALVIELCGGMARIMRASGVAIEPSLSEMDEEKIEAMIDENRRGVMAPGYSYREDDVEQVRGRNGEV